MVKPAPQSKVSYLLRILMVNYTSILMSGIWENIHPKVRKELKTTCKIANYIKGEKGSFRVDEVEPGVFIETQEIVGNSTYHKRSIS